MLKKYAKMLLSGIIFTDLLTVVFSWMSAYLIWFKIITVNAAPPPLGFYAAIGFIIAPVWIFILKNIGLYRPQRALSLGEVIKTILLGCLFASLVLLSASFFYLDKIYTGPSAIFILMSAGLLIADRLIIRFLLVNLRRKGYNLRRVLIIGTGELGQKVAFKVTQNKWMGLSLVGFLDDKKTKGQRILDKNVLGSLDEVKAVIKEHDVDQVFIALPINSYRKLTVLMRDLSRETVDIRVVPDIYQISTLNANVEDFDGIPILNLSESTLYGWNYIIKRVFDVAFSLAALTIIAPAIMVIAAMIKITSPGPVFYKQERMGLNGELFFMLKFRSMRADAETLTGAVWAVKDDPRRTKLGTFLRETSLDELPQFFNVLKGEMSIVGPRPERPVFIEKFKDEIPGYMFRHKTKSGITGWAQVNGYRGNTSLQKRIDHDLYYIEKWSLWFDIKIILLTVFKGFVNQNAY